MNQRLRVWYPFMLAVSVIAWIVSWSVLAGVILHESWRPRHGTLNVFSIAYLVAGLVLLAGMGPAGVVKYSGVLVVDGQRFSWKPSILSRTLVFDSGEIKARVVRREREQTRAIQVVLRGGRSLGITDYAWNFRALLKHLGIA